MRSKSGLHLIAVAAAAAFMSQIAVAQTETAQPSRAEIKAQTRAAEKAGKLAPAGQGPNTDPASKAPPTQTRAERKAATLQARKEGKLAPAGIAGQLKVDKAMAAASSTRSRSDRKADVLSEAKGRKLAPAGEVGEPKK